MESLSSVPYSGFGRSGRSYIAYRLIDPGYQLWNEMGIYQRELASFDQEPILENRLMDKIA